MDDGRKHQRCSIHWRSALTIMGNGGAETLQCKTNDISAGGVSVICPRNVFPGSELTVYLLIDAGSSSHPQVVFEAQGKVMNNVLSSQQGGFRLGIQFTKFAGDSQPLLKKHLPKDAVKPARVVTAVPAVPPAAPVPVAETPVAAPQPAAAAVEEVTPVADAPSDDAATAATAPPEGETPSPS
ncbi:MAG: PilZ domain-containing protein [Rhodocyclaceae bacterium]|nr:MAG: PilZ domain-containing protein [Rhodocyclaceae bacterium]